MYSAFVERSSGVRGWHRAAMTDAGLNDAWTVILSAALLSGDLEAAVAWYFEDRILIIDGLTPKALVQQGRTRDVLWYIETLEAGFAG